METIHHYSGMFMKIHTPIEIQIWPLPKLKPYERNARTHSDEQVEQIASSIREFGFTNPILVDSKDGIIAGHGRLMAAQKVGLAQVPVIVLDYLTDAQRRAYIIADNKLALNAGWDLSLLSKEIEALSDEGFDLELLGFTDEELSDLMPEVEQLEAQGDADDVPEVRAEPKVVRGEVYVLGKHRLMCGDSTSIDDVEKLMNGEKADMVFTDPPYGMAYESNAWDSKKSDVKSRRTDEMIMNDDTTDVGKDALRLLPLVTKEQCHFYIWCRWDCFADFLEVAKEIATVKGVVVWDKGGPGLGDLQCSYGDSEWAIHCLRGRKPLAERQNGVWQVNRMKGLQMVHPTQKPIELCERGIVNSTNKNELVLDLFGGSGSTLVASEKSGRRSNLMELDPKYCAVILDRWEKFTGRKAKREDGVLWDEIKGGD